MTTKRHPNYTSISVTKTARADAGRAAIDCTKIADRRVSVSDALSAAIRVALNHPEELAKVLAK